jgi:hypothetical protein
VVPTKFLEAAGSSSVWIHKARCLRWLQLGADGISR